MPTGTCRTLKQTGYSSRRPSPLPRLSTEAQMCAKTGQSLIGKMCQSMSLEFSRWWWCNGEGNVFFGTLQATLYQLSIFFFECQSLSECSYCLYPSLNVWSSQTVCSNQTMQKQCHKDISEWPMNAIGLKVGYDCRFSKRTTGCLLLTTKCAQDYI